MEGSFQNKSQEEIEKRLQEITEIGGKEAVNVATDFTGSLLKQVFGSEVLPEKRSSVCGKIWGGDTRAYRCRDCQVTPNSCICIDCFQAGDHVGHDCNIFGSGYGGCCDCGDPGAWRASGNCSHHGPNASKGLVFSQTGASSSIRAVINHLNTQLQDYYNRLSRRLLYKPHSNR
eukprot:TRINITY_DN469_c1_g2_i2.p1 TRINITY_DN469_c1_g2~~TRINITY_DN469_c1_g2_i2.p1  ORF type:complete len:174 (-),score=27.29 TRINITY_DN469_c1_g2_i2:52-573(-)